VDKGGGKKVFLGPKNERSRGTGGFNPAEWLPGTFHWELKEKGRTAQEKVRSDEKWGSGRKKRKEGVRIGAFHLLGLTVLKQRNEKEALPASRGWGC